MTPFTIIVSCWQLIVGAIAPTPPTVVQEAPVVLNCNNGMLDNKLCCARESPRLVLEALSPLEKLGFSFFLTPAQEAEEGQGNTPKSTLFGLWMRCCFPDRESRKMQHALLARETRQVSEGPNSRQLVATEAAFGSSRCLRRIVSLLQRVHPRVSGDRPYQWSKTRGIPEGWMAPLRAPEKDEISFGVSSAMSELQLGAGAVRVLPAPGDVAHAQHPIFAATQKGRFDEAILLAAEDFDVDPWVLKALLLNESGMNPKMRGWSGVGIASFTPAGVRGVNWVRKKRDDGHEFERFTMRQAMNPEKAIPAVAEYLAWGVRRFGSLEAGLGFWNGGFEHARKVRRWGYRGAKRRGVLKTCAGIPMSGVFVENVWRRANLLRAQAGLPPLKELR